MENKEVSMFDLIIETHIGLKRQGPGSSEMILKALSCVDNTSKITRVADLGCGTGGQTMTLAQHINGNIIGVDQFPGFIDVFNDNAKKLNLGKRVRGTVGSIENLSFEKEEFDLIWSEGAIDNIGFEKGLIHWHEFLKKGGYVVVTCPSWLTNEQPAEIDKFWMDAGSGLDTIGNNISIMQKAGYGFVAAFALPEKCWTDNYFIPRNAEEKRYWKNTPEIKPVRHILMETSMKLNCIQNINSIMGMFFISVKIHRNTKKAGE